MRRIWCWLALLVIALWAQADVRSAAAQAAFEVNTEADAVDVGPGDGSCETAAGDCSLRAAIQEANALAGTHTIEMPEGLYTLTLAGPNEDTSLAGDLDILDDVHVTGKGSGSTIIDGGRIDRIFHVPEGSVLSLRGMTIRNGHAGGDFGEGGAIYNHGSLTADDVKLLDNVSDFAGGALANIGVATLRHSEIRRNTSPNGGAIGNSLGFANNVLVIEDSVVADNRDDFTGARGGIFVPTATTHILRTLIMNNMGIGLQNGNSKPLTIDSSTIASNVNKSSGEADGAGIVAQGPVTIRNSTISGNLSNGSGAGITGSGPLMMNNVTLVNNVADADNNGYGEGGAIYWAEGLDRPQIGNSLLVDNADGGGESPDCDGLMTSLGHNLLGTSTCVDPVPGDIVADDGLIAPLGDNGRTILTHALLEGSPAIDAGNPVQPGSGGVSCESVDQRGVGRPRGIACDIGAYESDFERTSPIPSASPQAVPGAGGKTHSPSPPRNGAAAATVGILIAALGLRVLGAAFRGRNPD